MCETVTDSQCDDAGGSCVEVSRQECSLERRTVVKTTPLTGCEKVGRLLCAPRGCEMVSGPVECREETRSQLVDRPVEECQMSPITVCRPVTKENFI